jgi:hypothetical protein
MSEKAINRLRKERGKKFFVYDLTTAPLRWLYCIYLNLKHLHN